MCKNKYVNVGIIAVLVKRRAQTIVVKNYQQFLENSLNFYVSTDLHAWYSQIEIQIWNSVQSYDENTNKNKLWSAAAHTNRFV